MLIVFHNTALTFGLKATTKQMNTEVFLMPFRTKNTFYQLLLNIIGFSTILNYAFHLFAKATMSLNHYNGIVCGTT